MTVSIISRMGRPAAATLLAVMVLAAAATACGVTPKPEFSEIPEGAVVINQDGLKFRPGDVMVSAGDRVYFTNSEQALHTVTIDEENVSGSMERGDAFVWTFDVPGEYRVRCDYHPQMRATVTVEESGVRN